MQGFGKVNMVDQIISKRFLSPLTPKRENANARIFKLMTQKSNKSLLSSLTLFMESQ